MVRVTGEEGDPPGTSVIPTVSRLVLLLSDHRRLDVKSGVRHRHTETLVEREETRRQRGPVEKREGSDLYSDSR